jgi:riboflavin biosynthesis pyrimidine reductase
LLAAAGAGSLASTQVRQLPGPIIAPVSILELLRTEFGVSLLLHEGGPTLFGTFVAEGCVDELFVTIAPQLAGRDGVLADMGPVRPGLISGKQFIPETAPWLDLISAKQQASHLYLRYSMAARHPLQAKAE